MLPFHSKHFPLESLYRSNIFFFTIEPILAKAVTTVFDLFWPVMKGKHFQNDSSNGSHWGEQLMWKCRKHLEGWKGANMFFVKRPFVGILPFKNICNALQGFKYLQPLCACPYYLCCHFLDSLPESCLSVSPMEAQNSPLRS